MNAVLLLSGGMDSASIAFWIRPRLALTVDYGQICAEAELLAASNIARALSIAHTTLKIDLKTLGAGRMAGTPSPDKAPTPEWWPFRNQLLVTLGAAHAIKCNADSVLIGTLSTDDAHADGRPEFVHSMDALLRQQEQSIRLIAPALGLDALGLAKRVGAPRSVLAYSHSCHSGNFACGRCRGCTKRSETIRQLGWEASPSP